MNKSCATCKCNTCKMNENGGIYGGCFDCEDCKEQDLHCEDCSMYEYDKDRLSNWENNIMKRYKLTRSHNPETHASGEVIFIKDENGNELDVGFSNECDAFDYIKLQVENDKEYVDYLNNPNKHIMDMYNSLDEFDKKMIEQSLIQKYRNECMYQYFR